MATTVKIKRIAAGEYVAVNTLPTVRFSREAHDSWLVQWAGITLRTESKADGVAQVEDYASLADVVMANPIRIVGNHKSA